MVCLQDDYTCHSCYAFSAAGALESAQAIQTGQLQSLSEQQLVDCSSELIFLIVFCVGASKAPPVLYLSYSTESGTFFPFYAPMHTISYLLHGSECCMQNIALGTGSREQSSTRRS